MCRLPVLEIAISIAPTFVSRSESAAHDAESTADLPQRNFVEMATGMVSVTEFAGGTGRGQDGEFCMRPVHAAASGRVIPAAASMYSSCLRLRPDRSSSSQPKFQ